MGKKTIIIMMTLLLSSCASVIKGTDQTISFTSEPTGAEVIIDGQLKGVTPLSVRLKKNKYDTILIKKAGYQSIVKPLDKSFDPIALINVFWDLSTTDLITGAIYEYEPNLYHAVLVKSKKSE